MNQTHSQHPFVGRTDQEQQSPEINALNTLRAEGSSLRLVTPAEDEKATTDYYTSDDTELPSY